MGVEANGGMFWRAGTAKSRSPTAGKDHAGANARSRGRFGLKTATSQEFFVGEKGQATARAVLAGPKPEEG